MTRLVRTGGAVLLVILIAPPAHAGQAIGSMSIPVPVADLADVIGVHRDDPSTLALDIVRMTHASPEGPNHAVSPAAAAVAQTLAQDGQRDRLPLPLTPAIWRDYVLDAQVPDDRLASAILTRRSAAFLYHGLMGVDQPTLTWIAQNPAILRVLHKHPGASAVFARSVHIRGGAVETPGENAQELWSALVDADPRQPAAFITKLISARNGRLVAFYDAVMHLDAPHQRFAIGAPGAPGRLDRARRLLDALAGQPPGWRLEDHPFLRPEVDVALLLRLVAVDEEGNLVPPASRQVWARVFGGSEGAGGPVDAAWLEAAVLGSDSATARRRLDTFRFAQRALASDAAADPATLIAALHGFRRYPLLMLTLEDNGVRHAAVFASAARAADGLGGDGEATAVFQAGVGIVDRARRVGTLQAGDARALLASLVDAATSSSTRAAILAWTRGDLLGALRRAIPGESGADADRLVLAAIAGPPAARPPVIAWEGQRYRVDLSPPELARLTHFRGTQDEPPLDKTIASATPRNLGALAMSLAAIVYAGALGDPESPAATGGPVWRRHRFSSNGPGEADSTVAWRLAIEVFGSDGWHLAGSLLQLDTALAHLSLRRMDATEMPAASVLSTTDRRTLAISVVRIDSPAMRDSDRDEVAAAIARGRERVRALAADPGTFDRLARDAALSEWRTNGIRWLMAHGAPVAGAFTLLEIFRLGAQVSPAGWGTAAMPLDGSLGLRMPDPIAWEEYAGRAASGQLGAQLADVMLRAAEVLAALRLPAILMRDIAAFAMQEVIDRAHPAYFDDWLAVAFTARDLTDDRFADYISALTAGGPLIPQPGTSAIQ
jgi:hypothetical protein